MNLDVSWRSTGLTAPATSPQHFFPKRIVSTPVKAQLPPMATLSTQADPVLLGVIVFVGRYSDL